MTQRRRIAQFPLRPPALVPLLALAATLAAIASRAGAAGPATAASNPAPLIRAHGNDDRYWIIQVEDVAGDKGPKKEGRIYRRAARDELWRHIATIDSDVVALGSRVTQLAILMPDGSWLLLSDETATTGPALPNAARLIAFGADGGTLWAIGEPPPPGSAATKPAARGTALAVGASGTRPAAEVLGTRPSTGPSSATAPAEGASNETPTLALYSLQQHGWVRGVDLPPGAQGPAELLSLAFVDHEPVIAWRTSPKAVAASQLKDGIWWTAGEVKAEAPITRVKLVDGTPRPVLWAATAGEEGFLTWLIPKEPKRVAVPVGQNGHAEDLAVAYANGRVRVVGYQGNKLLERSYDPLTGADAGPAALLTLPKPPATPTVSIWVQPLLAVALIYVIVASVRRRQQLRDIAENPSEFVLAPVGRRLLAGTIDALPVLIACAVAWWQYASHNPNARVGESWDYLEYWGYVVDNMAPAQVALCAGGVVLYLLHTSLGEALAGRSIGKAVCRLRVVGLDGRPASPGAVVTRNVLRIIDLAMVFFPLLLILFSPLRQRAGDVAAGTLVVLSGKTKPVEPDPSTQPGGESAEVGSGSSRSDT
jgi:uncharacterized RDD family membrane protein YckC